MLLPRELLLKRYPSLGLLHYYVYYFALVISLRRSYLDHHNMTFSNFSL